MLFRGSSHMNILQNPQDTIVFFHWDSHWIIFVRFVVHIGGINTIFLILFVVRLGKKAKC